MPYVRIINLLLLFVVIQYSISLKFALDIIIGKLSEFKFHFATLFNLRENELQILNIGNVSPVQNDGENFILVSDVGLRKKFKTLI